MSSSLPPASENGDTLKARESPVNTTTSQGSKTTLKYQVHWHVLLVHFPISAFLGSFGFMVLHLITQTNCYELAAYVALIAGAIVMIPTTLSGWTAWKNRYKGIRGKIFTRKIRIAYAMMAISIVLVIYRSVIIVENLDILHNLWHFFYFLGTTLLFFGAVAEGYYGGRLNHR